MATPRLEKFFSDGGDTIAPGAWNERRISQTSGTTKIAAMHLYRQTRYIGVPRPHLRAFCRRPANARPQASSPRRKRNCRKVMKPTTATKTTDMALEEPTLNEVLKVS